MSTTAKETKPEGDTISIAAALPKEVHAHIAAEAEIDDRTINAWLRRFLVHHHKAGTLTTPTK